MKPTLKSITPRTFIAIAVLVLAFPAAANAAAAATSYTKESEQSYAHQLEAGEISEAKINRRDHNVLLTLKNGELVFIHVAKHDSEKIEAALRAKGVKVVVESSEEAKKEVSAKPVHHKIRYIVGGVVVVLLIAGVGYYLYDRKRKADEEYE